MIHLIPEINLSNITICEDDYVVFGGTFDPFHKGHISVVKTLLKYFNTVYIAPTVQNPWKNEVATSFNHRKKMIELILDHEGLSYSDKGPIIISDYQYEFAKEMVTHLRAINEGTLYWAVAEDTAQGVSSWKDWEDMNVTTVICSLLEGIHATLIRSGKEEPHPAIINYVSKNHLY